MELFHKAITVKLSYRDKFLTAQEDMESVCIDRDGSSRNAVWGVEFADGDQCLRLRSCYGKYLTASSSPFLPGTTAKKVVQSLPIKTDAGIEWEPIRDGFSVRLKTRNGHFLRPNGGLPPWRNSVTHDVPHRMGTQEKILWDVEVVDSLTKTQSPLLSLTKTRALSGISPNPTFPVPSTGPALVAPNKIGSVRH
ncbi:hypothetical protein NMG60_11006517 [Bertholletia excelsa]